ncbi:hypothetical protein GQ53DRAFT_834390 [Thozetella sp. PMI_491]|nr:hypothetical protein GQ53DRAFT_834390 [Thozetella sp. PMI_491]
MAPILQTHRNPDTVTTENKNYDCQVVQPRQQVQQQEKLLSSERELLSSIQLLQQSVITLQQSAASAIASVRSTADEKFNAASSNAAIALASAVAAQAKSPVTITALATITATNMATLTATVIVTSLMTETLDGAVTVTVGTDGASLQKGVPVPVSTAPSPQSDSSDLGQTLERKFFVYQRSFAQTFPTMYLSGDNIDPGILKMKASIAFITFFAASILVLGIPAVVSDAGVEDRASSWNRDLKREDYEVKA